MAHLGNTVVNGALRVLGGEYVDTINGVTVGSSPKFTDTNNSVTQTNTTANADYRVLFSNNANDTTETTTARKSSNLKFNPSTGNLTATQLNGVTIGSSPKFTDTDTKNTAGSTDTSSKIFLIGATSQAANPQTYSQDTAYVGTDGCLYSGGTKVLTAHQDISGKVNKSGDTMTNTLTIQRTGTHDNNYPASLNLWAVDSTNSVTSKAVISAYDGGASGANIVINPAGNMFIGSGEAPLNHYNLYTHNTGEVLYLTSDNQIHIQANGQTIANRLGLMIDNSGNVLPEKADTATNNSGSIGTSSYKWANGYFTNINGVAVGDSPKFTDNNNAVTQTATTTSADYEVLFSVTADNTTRTEGARKNSNLKFNPSTGNLQATQLNGVTIGSSPKFTDNDTKNTAGSTDTSSKIFLIGATSQAANPQTYSQDTAYVGTDGCLYSGGTKVLTAHQSITGKVDKKTTLDTYYGTCSTAAGTAAKVITVTDGATNFSLRAGITIVVKFTATNTAANPTFNVNSTGAKSVWYNTALITTGSGSLGYAGTANRPMQFIYDGTQWVFVGWSYDTNTNTVTQTATATDADYEVLFSATADNTTRTEGARKASGLIFNPSTVTLKTKNVDVDGGSLNLNTLNASSNDSADIVWFYGNGSEKCRIWTNDTLDSYTVGFGPNYRAYSSDGKSSILTKLALENNVLALTGGTMTGILYIRNTGSYIYSSGEASSATTFLKGSAFLNLCSPGIQCRNFGDNGWSGIAGTAFTPQNNSSRKIKENIKPITEEEAQKILEVNVVSFDYKQGVGFGDGDERKGKFGVIAEEINEIIPSVVSYQINDDHTIDYNIPSGVSYEKFVPYLIKMIQMQQKEIDDLKVQIKELQT